MDSFSLHYTRHGTSREGDDYQDLFGAEILIEFLEHPERYEWIQFESEDAFYLDDIIAKRKDGSYLYRQIKFTVASDDEKYEVSWNYLLEKKQGKRGLKESLLQKWAESFFKLNESGIIHEAALYTNKRPSLEVERIYNKNDNKINYELIKDESIINEIFDQLGSHDKAKTFFSAFKFFLDQPSPLTLEDSLKRRFLKLGGKEKGWLNLLQEIRRWAKFKELPEPDGKINYQKLRIASLWYKLRELPQGFEIPPDYVLPSEDFDDHLLKVISEKIKTCIVISGSPGVGKSTYISYLIDDLKKRNIPVIRHHYFLSLIDRSGDRYSSQIVIESLMHQIQTHYHDSLGDLANPNPTYENFSKWVEKCGSYFSQKSTPFVIIIDGLDHVWRERKSIDEMISLFDFLLPLPEGVILIIGTQKVSNDYLPPRLLSHAPREEWLELPFLTLSSIKKWLEYHINLMDLPENDPGRTHILNECAEAFESISKGHPLHLIYSFKALLKTGDRFWKEAILSLPQCPEGDIENYYQRLWDTLPIEGQQLLHLLAAFDFQWPKDGLVECLSSKYANQLIYMKAERQIEHLLNFSEIGPKAFHNSLLVFIKKQEDHEIYARNLLPNVLNWLSNRAPEYWRWAYEWIVKAKGGDSDDLQKGPDLNWLTEAIAMGRPINQITDIIQRAAWSALDFGDLSRVVELNILWQYITNAYQFEETTFGRLRFCQLKFNFDKTLYRRLLADFKNISECELLQISEIIYHTESNQILDQCLDVYEKRMHDFYTIKANHGRDYDSDIKSLINLAANARINAEKIINFINDRRDENHGKKWIVYYIKKLYTIKDVNNLQFLLECDLKNYEVNELSLACIRLACEEDIKLEYWKNISLLETTALYNCYKILSNKDFIPNLNVSSQIDEIMNLKDYELYSQRLEIVQLYHDIFFSSLAFALAKSEENLKTLHIQFLKDNWICIFCHYLINIANECAFLIHHNKFPSYSWIYEKMEHFSTPELEFSRNDHYYKKYATHALIEIALNVYLLGKLNDVNKTITLSNCEKMLNSSYWNQEIWTEHYVQNNRLLMEDEAVQYFFDHEQKHLLKTINYLNERADYYAKLAQIAAIHGEKYRERCLSFLNKSALCLMGYGSHKDVLLHDIFDILESCFQANIGDTKQWLLKLIPMIHSITDFTDGDETNYLKVRLAKLLLLIRPDLFSSYYQYLIQDEEWYYSEKVMHSFLENANLSDPINKSIALTVVDEDGLRLLKERTDMGDRSAQLIFNKQKRFLGGIIFKKESQLKGSFLDSEKIKNAPKASNYPPTQLKQFIDKLSESRLGYRHELIEEWFDHWVKTNQAKEICEVFEELENQKEHSYILYYLLDRMFDLNLSLKGKTHAYKWLIKSHQNRSSWSRWETNEETANDRFKKISKYYPEKWMDFIKDVLPKDENERKGKVPYFGFDRLVDYCIIVGQHNVTKKIAESSIRIANERISDLDLPTPNWITSEKTTSDNIKLLFLRLEWPSILVRERASSQILDLYKQKEHQKTINNYFLDWLSNRNLESYICNALAIPLKLKFDGLTIYPDKSDLENKINYPSLLSHLLLAELYDDWNKPISWSQWHSGRASDDFCSAQYFNKYKTAFLPPIYTDYAESIEERFLIPFQRQWAYEWEKILERTGLSKSDQAHYFFENSEPQKAVYIDVPQSEVYRSAFLRTLAWAVDEAGLSENIARKYALKCFPLDIGLWQIRNTNKPMWWPKTKISKGNIDTTVGYIWENIENLWKDKEIIKRGKILCQATGPVIVTDDILYYLEIYGAFQRCEGEQKPGLEEIHNWLASRYTTTYSPTITLKGKILTESLDKNVRLFDDWSMAPTSFRLIDWPNIRWQAQRMYYGIWFPASYLFESEYEIRINEKSLSLNSNNQIISTWQAWHDNLQERWYLKVPPTAGEYLFINREVIKQFCETTNSNFCWVVGINIYYRKDRYKEFQSFKDIKVFGAGSIIR